MAEEVDVDHNRHRSKSHSPTDAVEDADDPFKWHPPPPSRRSHLLRRRVVVCCGCCAALAALFAVLLLVLALTIYKVRDPEMTVNNIIISTAQPPSSSSSTSNVTSVLVDASMRNPNAVPYYFDESTTWFRYEDIEVGVARGPPGMAAAGRTYRVNVTVEVDGEGLAEALREVGREGEMAVDSVTEVRGHVRVLGIVRHQVDVTMNCTVTVAVGNWTVVGQSCAQEVYD